MKGKDLFNFVKFHPGNTTMFYYSRSFDLCTYDTFYRRLKSLEKQGLVSSEKIGNEVFWNMPSDKIKFLANQSFEDLIELFRSNNHPFLNNIRDKDGGNMKSGGGYTWMIKQFLQAIEECMLE